MIKKTNSGLTPMLKGFALFPVLLVLLSAPGRCDWLPKSRVSGNDFISVTTSSNQNVIAADVSGNLHFVYLDSRNNPLAPTFEVYYREYYAAGRWSSETQLTHEVTWWEEGNPVPITEFQDKETPGIALDSLGNIYVSYANKVTQSPWVKMVVAGRSIPPWELDESCGTGVNPVIAVDSSNNVHAVWKGLAGGESQIFYRCKTYDGDWGRTEQLTTGDSDKLTPAIIVDGEDNLHVVWADDRDVPDDCPDPAPPGEPGPHEIYYKRKPASGRWSGPVRLSNASCSSSLQPFIAAGPSGELHVVWEDDRDGNAEIYYISYSGTWRRPEQRLTTVPFPSQNPHLTVDGAGQIHLTWQDNRFLGGIGETTLSLFYKQKDPAAGWGEDTRLTRKGFRGSITAEAENLHLAYSANYSTEPGGNPQVYYLKSDPDVSIPPTPNEVILVLDISGSMDNSADGMTPFTRLYRSKQALSNFLDRYNLRNPTDAYFGLVTFPHRSRVCPSSETVIPLTPLNEVTRLEAISDTIPSLGAGGITPLLDGYRRARDLLSTSTEGEMILLVSDGFHNCPDTTIPAGFPDTSYPLTYTVGIGTPVELDRTCLSRIATATGGEFVDTTSVVPIDWVKSIIQDILGVEAECDPAGRITARGKQKHPILITNHDTNIAFDISWSTPRPDRVFLLVHTPGGQIITPGNSSTLPGVTHISRDTYRICYLGEEYLKTIKRAGEWILEVVGGKAIPPRISEPYRYSVLMESSLKMNVKFDRKTYNTTEFITLEVAVREKDKPLKANCRLLLHAPQNSPGNWFAKSLAKKGIPKSKAQASVSGDPVSAIIKRDRMLTQKYKKPFCQEIKTFSYILKDDGRRGDKKAGDGIYTFVLPGPKIPGTYIFDITARGKTSSGQPFRRQLIEQKFVYVKTIQRHTAVDLKRVGTGSPAGNSYDLTITPKDAGGNYLGPGNAAHISFFTQGIKLRGAARDNLDGSYTQKLLIPGTSTGKQKSITVYIHGTEMVLNLRVGPKGRLFIDKTKDNIILRKKGVKK
ncbi:MAG: VWA domain-containing protein [Candidatus Aminicenantes bacterium]|nr:VWA domain-containing protein [Candidatus Aminicenantes bacterium]